MRGGGTGRQLLCRWRILGEGKRGQAGKKQGCCEQSVFVPLRHRHMNSPGHKRIPREGWGGNRLRGFAKRHRIQGGTARKARCEEVVWE